MKRGVMKNVTFYALIALLVAAAVLPLLKAMAPQFFPEGFKGREHFNDGPAPPPHVPAPSCENSPCAEGQFCSDQKRCEPRFIGGAVPDGSE
jgi:hypothetical protein